jgi:NADPH oxidase
MVNFTKLAIAQSPKGDVGRIITVFLLTNFTSGPGATGWIMTIALGAMVWFAVEKRRRRPNGGFEWFYYAHYIGMIIFFSMWQLHGMFCMISTCSMVVFCAFLC